jgi:hypothetical protein
MIFLGLKIQKPGKNKPQTIDFTGLSNYNLSWSLPQLSLTRNERNQRMDEAIAFHQQIF